jgi:AAHS family 3-hydroxyphenylpropionic acid transporter
MEQVRMASESGVAPQMAVTRRAAATTALSFGAMMIEGFDIQAMGVAAPALGPELDLSREVLGQALSAANIGLVFGAILGGWLADVFGRKPVLICNVVLFGLFTLATTQATTYDGLFWARLLTGVGFGGALPNLMAIAADISRPGRRGFTGATLFCGLPVGGGIVALVSWLGYQGEWRPLFYIGGAIPLVLAPLMAIFMVETRTSPHAGTGRANVLPWLAAVPLGVAGYVAVSMVSALPGAASLAGMAPWLGGLFGLIGAYVIVHRRPLFANGRVALSILLWAIFVPTLLILYFVLLWLPTLIADKGFTQDASLSAVFFNFLSVFGALFFGALADRFGLRWPLISCYLGLMVSLIALGAANSFLPVMALCGAVGFFVLGANYALYGSAAGYYPPAVRGRGSGAAIAWGRMGAVSGPLIGGYLLQNGSSPGESVYAMAPFAAFAAICVFALTALRNTEM